MIRVLITDDSKFMRVNLERILAEDPNINVVGTASNGLETLRFLERESVDVVILDFFMPKMNGIETLEEIMQRNPLPIIMFSIANEKLHADLYFRALQLGAIDIIPKPVGIESMYIDQMKQVLLEKIRVAAQSRVKLHGFLNHNKIIDSDLHKSITTFPHKGENIGNDAGIDNQEFKPPFWIVVIGASTGGPSQVFELIKNLQYKSNLSIIIVQHMPGGFTEHYARRLSQFTAYRFIEPQNGEKINAGVGYVAPGNYHLHLTLNSGNIEFQIDQSERVKGVRPCIDYAMISAAKLFKHKCYGVLLTGMGKDGAEGIEQIKKNNGITFTQRLDEALITSMPEAAIKTGCVDYILPIEKISFEINTQIV